MSDKILSFFIDGLSIGLALAGIMISYHPPRSKSAKVKTTIGLLIAGFGIFIAQRAFQSQSETLHASEVSEWQRRFDEQLKIANQQSRKLDEQSRKLDAVSNSTVLYLNSATRRSDQADLSTPGQKEITRRQKILAALRNEYILSHDNISPAVMSGIQNPPADWVNERLKSLGEKWTIGEQYPLPSLSPEIRCSMNLSECSNQNIKDKVARIADALEAAYSEYAQYQKAPIAPGQEHRHAVQLSTMRTMAIFQYRGDPETTVVKYRHELIRRLGTANADSSYDYLYEPTRQHEIEDFREIARDLKGLATRLPIEKVADSAH